MFINKFSHFFYRPRVIARGAVFRICTRLWSTVSENENNLFHKISVISLYGFRETRAAANNRYATGTIATTMALLLQLSRVKMFGVGY